jgi:hypothetical protein
MVFDNMQQRLWLELEQGQQPLQQEEQQELVFGQLQELQQPEVRQQWELIV